MKTRLAFFVGLILTLAVSVAYVTADDPLKPILENLEKFRSEYPQEKVHIHLDKPYYAVGDSIWFKAYVVDAEAHQLSTMSKVLYVDLINEKNTITQSLKLPLTDGLAWGDFQLTDSLAEGNYRIRAYTNYMRNFGEEYFFDKTFSVGNAISNNIITTVHYTFSKEGSGQKVEATINYTDIDNNPITGKEVSYDVQLDFKNIAKGKAITDGQGNITVNFTNTQPFILKSGRLNTTLIMDKERSFKKDFPIKSTSTEVNVQFFPESGEMVNGIRSKVAFKAVAPDGLGIVISGYVSDHTGVKIAELKSEHAGMGYFAITPQAGHTYIATIKLSDGSEKKFDLPKASAEGYVLAIGNNNPDSLNIRISASPGNVAAGGELTLVAQANSVIKFASKNKLSSSAFNAYIPKNRFPTGILQLTLFNQQNQPVAERLVFINHQNNLTISVNAPKTSSPRKKVLMELDIKNPEGKPALGSFSVAVTDATKVTPNENNETTILSNLLLSSDIKGYIEQPNYYFANVNPTTIRELDILMLTQGWRRFTWKNIIANNFPPLTYKFEDGVVISGRVTKGGGKPIPNGKVTLLSSTGSLFFIDTVTDADGRFKFRSIVFPDSTKFVVQARSAQDKKFVEIELDRLPPQLVTLNKNAADIEINVNKSLTSYLKNSRNQFEELRRYGKILLNDVKIIARKENTVKGSSNWAGHADAIITSSQLEHCINLSQCLQGRVAGLIVQGGIPYLARNLNTVPMQIILDGMQVEADFLSMISPQDVEGIEVLKGASASIYGMRGGGGVLIITTKTGGGVRSSNIYAPGIVTYSPKGFYIAKEFYAPNYDDPKVRVDVSDLRTTIYWNPKLITENGKVAFNIFNAGSKGTYRAVIEGIDIDGNLGHYVYTYTVN